MSSSQIQNGAEAKPQRDVSSTNGRGAETRNPAYIRARSHLIDTINSLEHLKSSNEPCSMAQFEKLYELIRVVGEFAPNSSHKQNEINEILKLHEQLDVEKSKCSALEGKLNEGREQRELLNTNADSLLAGFGQARTISENLMQGVMSQSAMLRGTMLGLGVRIDSMKDMASSPISRDVSNGLASHSRQEGARKSHGNGSLDRFALGESKPKGFKRRLAEAYEEDGEAFYADRPISDFEKDDALHATGPKRRRAGSGDGKVNRVHHNSEELRNATGTTMVAHQIDGVIDLTSPHLTKSELSSAKYDTGIAADGEKSSSGYRGHRLHATSGRNDIRASDPQALTGALRTVVEEGRRSPVTFQNVEEDDINSIASTQILEEMHGRVPGLLRESTASDDEASDKENTPPEPKSWISNIVEGENELRGASEDLYDEMNEQDPYGFLGAASDPTLLRRNCTPERQFGDVLAMNDVLSPEPATPLANDDQDARVKSETHDDEAPISVIIDDSEDEVGGDETGGRL
ncbi:MAG: hypothetical protein Q9160_004553 [Pyrenula sp. 1 TL-2023]